MAALAAFAGGLPIWAGFQMIVQGRGEQTIVELEGLAGVAAAAIVLLVFTVVIFRASANKLVYTSMASLLVLQSAESLFWTVDDGWTWLLSLPLGNAYLLVLLLVTLPTASQAPPPLQTFPTLESYTTLPSPNSSPRSKTVALPPAPPAPQEEEALDTLGSRWSVETDKKKGLKTILKNAAPAARRGGHRRGGTEGGEGECAMVMLDLQGLKEAKKDSVHFSPTPQPEVYPQQQQPAPLAPNPSFRSLLRSPSSTVAGSLAHSPDSSVSSSNGPTVFPPPQPQPRPQPPPRAPPRRSRTYPPMPILPTPPPLAPSLPARQQQDYQLPLHPAPEGNSFHLYTSSPSQPHPYPSPPPNRLVNPYSPVFPRLEHHELELRDFVRGAGLQRAASSSSSLIDPAVQRGRKKVAWKRPE
ncbi:hypothetical protein BCR35DRAFT_340185 [Leucosporidium creatinivorum]|uniref:Uncharacterized protein n=1 Tax=Leucosporidium creatinivorum TaxID=106004 RepID=A0A1Y2FLS4_9BASI|nr:hypothetical protein BCR35DRAFT_340185 [Leucosporidium creatinivorum]